MMENPELASLPDIPLDENGPVFSAPWQAQAFALAVNLQRQGLITWDEWALALGSTIREAQAEGDPDLGDTYYIHWLNTLEKIAITKGLAESTILAERKRQVTEEHKRLHGHDH